MWVKHVGEAGRFGWINTDRHRNRETDIQRDRHGDRQKRDTRRCAGREAVNGGWEEGGLNQCLVGTGKLTWQTRAVWY